MDVDVDLDLETDVDMEKGESFWRRKRRSFSGTPMRQDPRICDDDDDGDADD